MGEAEQPPARSYSITQNALISDVLPFGRLWYGGPNAISYVKHRSRHVTL
jgi:hypothetical protein